jgi:hypothetical protein
VTAPAAKLEMTQATAGQTGLRVNLPTGAEATASAVRAFGYSPAFELMDKDSTQNWYLGIDDNDANKLLIGRGYGPGQGVAQAITVDTSDNVGIGANATAPGSTLDVGGSNLTAMVQNLATWGLNARVQGLMIIPEGNVRDDGAGTLQLYSTVIVMNPASGSWVRVAAGSYVLGSWGYLYINLPPTSTRGTTVAPSVGTWTDSDVAYAGRDRIVLAQRMGTGLIFTRFTQQANQSEYATYAP